MSKLVPWEPFDELLSMRRDFDRLFEQAFRRPFAGVEGPGAPLVDLYQTEEEVVAKLAIPGVRAEDIDIQVSGEVLSVRGEMKHEEEAEEAAYHVRERRYGSFARSLSLPAPVVADKARAEIEDGILTLTLPKAEEVLPKTIEVKAK